MLVLFMVAVPKLPEESVNTSVIYIKDKGLKSTFDSPADISVLFDVLASAIGFTQTSLRHQAVGDSCFGQNDLLQYKRHLHHRQRAE